MFAVPNTLAIDVVVAGDGSGVQARPLVDGRDLLAEVFDGWSAEDPRHLHSWLTDAEVRLAEADCTEGCCGAIYVTVRHDGDQVVWSDWRNPDEPSVELTEMRFDAGQYRAEVERAAADLSWEWPARTVARLVETGLRARPDWSARWECELTGVSTWRPDEANVLLIHPGRDAMSRHRPWLQFRVVLAITADDPADQAARHVERLLTGDPRAIGRLSGGVREFAEQLGYHWPPVW
jgi:hypothetical protein